MDIRGQLKWRDRPKYWTTGYSEPPLGFGEKLQKQYQNALNAIAGKSRDRPILLLEWGGNAKTKKYVEWSKLTGLPLEEREEPKYKLRRESEVLPGVYLFYPIRRWIISQRQEPEQYGYGNDDDITFENELGLKNKAAEKEKELYTPLIYIGDHTYCPPKCCEDKLCVGDYKNPSMDELNWIAEKTWLLQKERIVDPYSQLTPEDMAKIAKEIPKKESISDIIEKIIHND